MKKQFLYLLLLGVALSIGNAWAAITAHDLSSSNFSKTFSSSDNCTINAGDENWGIYSKVATSVSSGKLNLPTSNISSSNNFFSIPLTGIAKGKVIAVEIASSKNLKLAVDEKTDYKGNISSSLTAVSLINSKITYCYTMTGNGGDAVLYFGRNGSNGTISSITIKVADPIENPVFTYSAGKYYVGLIPEITCATEGATIYYKNADKSDRKDITSTGAISAQNSTGSVTFSAYALKDGVYSDIVKVTYTLESLPSTLAVSPAAGTTYNSAQNVTFTSTLRSNGVIKYTTSGSSPSWSSTSYDGTPIVVDETTTIKARVFETTGEGAKKSSSDITFTYTIVYLEDPSFSLSATTIPSNGSAQIKVGDNAGLDGITLSDIDYGTSGVVTVTSAGVVTPVAAGTTTITFNTAATAKYNASDDNELTITVTAPDVTAPVFVSSTPANEATDVAVSGTISLTFDENVNSVDATKFSLSAGTKGEVSVDGSNAKIVKVAYSAMPNNTNITLSVAAGAVSDASGNSSAALSNITFKTVKAKLAKPTIVGTSFFKSSVHVTITSIEGATITYSTDGSSYSAYPSEGLDLTADATIYAKATHSDYTASDASNKKFKKFSSLVESAESVSAATTWDWSENGQTVQLKDDGTTFPYKGESGDIVASNFNGSIFSGNASWTSGFNASALVFEAVEYPTRSSYYQGQKVKFTTTVPGTVQVWYSNTGTKEVARYVDINGTEYGNADGGAGSKNQTIIPTPPVFIQAGLITITGVENHVATYVHIQKIVFTPMPATISGTISSIGWNTYASQYPLDLSTLTFGSGTGKAYYASDKNAGANTITLAPIADEIPAGQGILINGVPETTFTISTTTAGTLSGNLLVGTISETTVTSPYVLAGIDESVPYFQQYSGTTIAANKAYLPSDVMSAAAGRIRFVIEDVNNATGVENINSDENVVKFIENGKLLINRDGIIYDALGRKVR